ncbi:hypothetical protein RSAG8_02291, partial [Rhizoctonia solani AG-8 WAC10335]
FGTLVRGGIPPIFANLASEGINAKSDDPIDPTGNLGPTLSHLSDRPTAPLAPLLRMSTITQISRAQIANVAGQAHGPWLQHLQPRDRIRALTQLATLYACLGFRRKEVYILRELLACIVDLIICAREEMGASVSTGRMSMVSDTNESRAAGWPGAGANQPGEISESTGEIGVRIAETAEGNASILRVVKYVCEIYGIDVSRVQVGLEDVGTRTKDGGGADDEIELDSPRFGWREVQVGVVREAVQIAEALPDHRAVAHLALISLRQLNTWMNPNDQHHLYALASRSLATAHRRGDSHKIDFWCWKPVISVEVVPSASDRMPVERPWKDLAPSEADAAKDAATWYSFNPRARRRGNTKATVVQNEIVELAITLQNPFAFDLEVQSLALSTTGASIQTTPVSLLIPANSFHVKHISCTPLEAGTLVVRGCMVQLPNSTPKEFTLPLASEAQEASIEKRRSRRMDDMEMGANVSTGRMSMVSDANESRAAGWPGAGANQPGEISESTGEIGVRIAETAEGNASILRVVKYVCEIYGIDVSRVQVGLEDVGTGTKDGGGADDEIELDSPRFGWREVQVGVVREAVQIAEALPDHRAVAQLALISLRQLNTWMNPTDQHHLYTLASRSLATAHRRGDSHKIDFWCWKPVISVEVVPSASDRMPVERPWKDLAPSEADAAKDAATWYSFNPRARRRGNTKATVVQNEIVELAITLQNPFAFDLEVQSLALSTTGASIQTTPVSLLIPANSFHVKHISCTPLEVGTLVVRGCMVQLPNSTPKEFTLPLASEAQEASIEKRRSRRMDDMVRVKASGLDARRQSTLISEPPVQERKEEFLECRVVPQLPLLRVRRTSLTHGALMLYAGECFRIRLTVENVSLLPIDFLRMSFEDSTLPALQQALAEGVLTVAEAYETEYELVNRPVLKWDLDGVDAPNMTLAPRQKMPIWVTCFGKEGCTNATMRIHYSLARRDQVPTPESFFLRSLSY